MRAPWIALLALSLAGCSAGKDMTAAEQGVTALHQAFGSGKFGAVYDGSAAEMKNSISRDGFIRTFGGIYGRTGAYKSGKTTGWKVNYGTNGNMVALNRDAQFQNAKGTEEFVFRMRGGKAVLAGYHIKTDLPVAQ
jgi:hypothetical protein